jgi:molecular chaperone HscB
MDLTRDYFTVFDLAISYEIDAGLLKQRYLALQRQYHPDRFASGSAQEQRLAVQSASALNQAYDTLRSPVKRAQYLLELAGVEMQGGEKTNSDIDFLMAQMNLREQMAAVPEAAEPFAELDVLMQKAKLDFAALETEFSAAYSNNELESAVVVREKMQFYSKLITELQELEEHLEGSC